MAETLYVDYAWQHPAPAKIKSAGYSGALRYFSHDASKDITADEVKALHRAGLVVGIVWETTAKEAEAGRAAGAADRAEAEKRAAALGYPKNCPIFYAVDEGVDPSKVVAYFQGVHAGAKYPVGVYGSIAVVDYILAHGYAVYGWQTCAWSNGKVSQKAHIYQRQHRTRPAVASGGYDEDVQLRPLPLWGPHSTAPAPKPAPAKPQPTPAPRPKPKHKRKPKPAPKPAAKPTPTPTPQDQTNSLLTQIVALLRRILAVLRKPKAQ